MVEKADDTPDLKRELTKVRREARKAQREAEISRKALASLETQLEATKANLEARDEALENRTKELAERKRKQEVSQRETTKLKKEASERRRQLAAAEKTVTRLNRQADDLRRRLDDEKKKSDRLRGQVTTARREAQAARETVEVPQRTPSQQRGTSADQTENTPGPSSQKPGKEEHAMNAKSEASVEEQIVRYEHAKSTINLQRRVQANRIVGTYSAVAAGVGVVPVAVVDIAGLVTVQLMMLSKLADTYKVKFSGNLGRTVISAILGSLVPTSLKASTIGLIRSVPIFGPLLGLVTMPAYSWTVTYAIGTVFTDLFEQNKDLENIDIDEAKSRVKKVLDSVDAQHAAEAAKGAAA